MTAPATSARKPAGDGGLPSGLILVGDRHPPINRDGDPAAYFRREFDVADGLVAAKLFVSALGVVEPYLNGRRIGDAVLEPGWTSYWHRLLVRQYDVTEDLRPGRNAVGAIDGEGWSSGGSGMRPSRGEPSSLTASTRSPSWS